MRRKPKKSTNLHQKIKLLESKLSNLERSLRPLVLEKQAIEESRSKILISCDASVNNNRSSTGIVIRMFNKDPYVFSKHTNSTNSNEAELDAIYNGICTFESMFANSSTKIPNIEIRTDSKYCIDLLRNKKKVKELQNKVDIINSKIKTFSSGWLIDVNIIWKRRNSTFDLAWADRLSKGE